MSKKSFFEAVVAGEPVKVHLPFAGFVVGPGVFPEKSAGYRITFYWFCRSCKRTFPNAELVEDLCPDCWRTSS